MVEAAEVEDVTIGVKAFGLGTTEGTFSCEASMDTDAYLDADQDIDRCCRTQVL